MTLYRFAWDVSGAFWQGPIPICPLCGALVIRGDSRRVPIAIRWPDRASVECDCGATWLVVGAGGEEVEIPTGGTQ